MHRGGNKLETIAQRIKKARNNLNLKQKELAKKANITEANLSRYENGLSEPKSAVLSRLADALEVSIDYLLGISEFQNHNECDISKKSEKDLESILKNTQEMLQQDGLMFCGKPASKEAIDTVLKSIKIGMFLAIEEEKNK